MRMMISRCYFSFVEFVFFVSCAMIARNKNKVGHFTNELSFWQVGISISISIYVTIPMLILVTGY